jgi:hypothetical protein
MNSTKNNKKNIQEYAKKAVNKLYESNTGHVYEFDPNIEYSTPRKIWTKLIEKDENMKPRLRLKNDPKSQSAFLKEMAKQDKEFGKYNEKMDFYLEEQTLNNYKKDSHISIKDFTHIYNHLKAQNLQYNFEDNLKAMRKSNKAIEKSNKKLDNIYSDLKSTKNKKSNTTQKTNQKTKLKPTQKSKNKNNNSNIKKVNIDMPKKNKNVKKVTEVKPPKQTYMFDEVVKDLSTEKKRKEAYVEYTNKVKSASNSTQDKILSNLKNQTESIKTYMDKETLESKGNVIKKTYNTLMELRNQVELTATNVFGRLAEVKKIVENEDQLSEQSAYKSLEGEKELANVYSINQMNVQRLLNKKVAEIFHLVDEKLNSDSKEFREKYDLSEHNKFVKELSEKGLKMTDNYSSATQMNKALNEVGYGTKLFDKKLTNNSSIPVVYNDLVESDDLQTAVVEMKENIKKEIQYLVDMQSEYKEVSKNIENEFSKILSTTDYVTNSLKSVLPYTPNNKEKISVYGVNKTEKVVDLPKEGNYRNNIQRKNRGEKAIETIKNGYKRKTV